MSGVRVKCDMHLMSISSWMNAWTMRRTYICTYVCKPLPMLPNIAKVVQFNLIFFFLFYLHFYCLPMLTAFDYIYFWALPAHMPSYFGISEMQLCTALRKIQFQFNLIFNNNQMHFKCISKLSSVTAEKMRRTTNRDGLCYLSNLTVISYRTIADTLCLSFVFLVTSPARALLALKNGAILLLLC